MLFGPNLNADNLLILMNVLVACEERRKLRSKTFPGIADAMADQWGGKIIAT